ncbi:MAG TPA: carotenoid biosynthesis protein [Cyclobacteriaceae bacterium]
MKSSCLLTRDKIAGLVLIIIHLVGVVGYNIDLLHPIFLSLSPYTIILSVLLMLSFDTNINSRLLILLVIIFLLGMIVEIVGVRTGIIFGEYHYTNILGLHILGVPITLGFTWAGLVYAIGMIFQNILSFYFKLILSVVVLVLLDYLIEPIAIELNYWIWEMNGEAPFFNYLGWSFTGLIMFFLFYRFKPRSNNKLAIWFLAAQVIFFGLFNLYILFN